MKGGNLEKSVLRVTKLRHAATLLPPQWPMGPFHNSLRSELSRSIWTQCRYPLYMVNLMINQLTKPSFNFLVVRNHRAATALNNFGNYAVTEIYNACKYVDSSVRLAPLRLVTLGICDHLCKS